MTVTYQLTENEFDYQLFKKIKAQFAQCNQNTLDYFEIAYSNRDANRYSYQWMDEYSSLIHRWDNSPHHAHIPTFPYHQHIGSEENVHPSELMTLEKVLDFISKNIP